jgi:hypothetical protein
MHRSRGRLVAVLVLCVLVCTACAAGPNAEVGQPPDAGFWLGLWHGFIVPVTFVISLFTDEVTIYEVANDGNWYDFGYVLGLGFVLGGGAGSGSAAGRRRR